MATQYFTATWKDGAISAWHPLSREEAGNLQHRLEISYDWVPSPFGEALVMGTEHGLCGFAFAGKMTRAVVFADMQKQMQKSWPKASFREAPGAFTYITTDDLWNNKGQAQLLLRGSEFQIKVWDACHKASTYGEIARLIGRPKGSRAVGGALAINPLSWLIPCHQIRGSTGELTGYRWGLGTKQAILATAAAG